MYVKFMDVGPKGSTAYLYSCEMALDFHLPSSVQGYMRALPPRQLHRVR